MDENMILDIENAILRSSLSAEEIASAYGVTVWSVKKVMRDLLAVKYDGE